MATFKFGRTVDIHWNGYEIVGPADTVFSIPDQLYEEFDSDISPVEPTLQWIDTNEFNTLKNTVPSYTVAATAPITISSATNTAGAITKTWALNATYQTAGNYASSITASAPLSGSLSTAGAISISLDTTGFQSAGSYQAAGTYVNKVIGTSPASVSTASGTATISITSGTAGNGYLLAADGLGGTIWNPASTSGLTSVVGVSPISSVVSGGVVSVSLTANYQTAGSYQAAGNYASSVSATSPISATLSTAGVLSVSIDGTVTTAENAARICTKVRNSTVATISKGTVVYIDGSSGTVPTIQKALANADATSSRTFGIVEADITSNSDGYVTNQGLLTPLDTSAAGIVDGAVLWLSPTIAGAYTTTKPSGPNHGVLVGIVVKGQSAGAGSIYVLIKNGAELDEIHDVNISALANGQALIYSSTASVWQNQVLPVASVSGTSPISATTTTSTGAVSLSITAGSINSTHLSASSVGASQIIDASIGSAELADNAVVAAKIAAASVGTAKISSGLAASGTFLRADGAGAAAFASISSAVISEFTASGTWVKPSGTTAVYVMCVGGGGGGAGGAHGAGAANAVGPGGSGGMVVQRFLIGSAVSASVTVTIGQGGTSTAGSATGVPAAGANGSNTTFGTDVFAGGGAAGAGVSADRFTAVGRMMLLIAANNTSASINNFIQPDGSGAQDAGSSGLNHPTGADGFLAAGGGGGGQDGALSSTASGIYIALSTSTNGLGGGAAGVANVTVGNGSNGNNGTRFGEGGSGGGSSSAAASTGGRGGNGYLGGGGGGGGDGVSASGAGGVGGNGYCLVISW